MRSKRSHWLIHWSSQAAGKVKGPAYVMMHSSGEYGLYFQVHIPGQGSVASIRQLHVFTPYVA